jgi:uncharacterized membrane protein YeaQ/YmgE (transglycosylase-associated protein family)
VEPEMHLSSDSLLVMLVVGGVAGWLAGLVMRGSGYGIIGDIIVGLLGAFVGSYLVGALRLSVHVGNPVLDKGVVAFIGAVVLLFVIGFFRPRTFGERVSAWFRRR